MARSQYIILLTLLLSYSNINITATDLYINGNLTQEQARALRDPNYKEPPISQEQRLSCQIELCLVHRAGVPTSIPYPDEFCPKLFKAFYSLPEAERRDILNSYQCPVTAEDHIEAYYNQLKGLHESLENQDYQEQIAWLRRNGYEFNESDFTSKDYGNAQSSQYTMNFTAQPGRGRARIGFFIPTETSGIDAADYTRNVLPSVLNNMIPSLESTGDNRSFNPFADISRHRAVADVDYENGTINLIINPTCDGRDGTCHSPLPLNLNNSPDFFDIASDLYSGDKQNYVDIQVANDGSINFDIGISNSQLARIAPTLNGNITLTAIDNSGVDVNVNEAYTDNYPSIEIYHYPANSPNQPSLLWSQEAAGNAAIGAAVCLPSAPIAGNLCNAAEVTWDATKNTIDRVIPDEYEDVIEHLIPDFTDNEAEEIAPGPIDNNGQTDSIVQQRETY